MDPIIKVAFVSAIATAFIAIFSGVSLWLAFTIRAGDKMYRRQVKDLYEAIVISNLLTDPDITKRSWQMEDRIKGFKEHYKGRTPIFD
ncbi:MAG: hypothetical protein JSV38_06830 [Desulfobacterales bacterium]|nr:MAG: hypothetical protein JSV38_06830 [Desulfobacterales bacterium]